MNKRVVVLALIGAVVVAVGCNQKPKEEASLMQEIAYENEMLMNTEASVLTSQSPTDLAASAQGGAQAVVTEAAANTVVTENPTTKNIQQALKNAGLYEGKIDGSIGPKSKQAIRDFQAQNDLKVDGKVGRQTWARLGPYLSRTQTASTTDATAQSQQMIIGE